AGDHLSDGALVALGRCLFKADDRVHPQSHRLGKGRWRTTVLCRHHVRTSQLTVTAIRVASTRGCSGIWISSTPSAYRALRATAARGGRESGRREGARSVVFSGIHPLNRVLSHHLHLKDTPTASKERSVMKIRPLHDRVIVKRLEEDRTSPGGIVIPDTPA